MSMQEFDFGRYRLIPSEHLLLRDGEAVALTPKAFDVLVVLVRRAGRLVEKDELLREVWPDTSVEESNVAQNIFALRRALGDDVEYIETVPKRGYRFLLEVTERTAPAPAAARPGLRVVLALIAFVVVASAVSVYLVNRTGRDARTSEPRTLSMVRLVSGSRIPSAVISPDGRYVAHVSVNGAQASILLRQVSTLTDLVVVPPDPEASYWGLSFSADGDSLYFIKHSGTPPYTTLYNVPVLGGTPRKVLDRIDSVIGVSPDGKRIAFVRDEATTFSSLVIANADGSGERVLATRRRPKSFFSSGNRGGPSWSPDGTTIATGVISLDGGYHGDVFTVSVRDGGQRLLTSHRWYQVAQTAWIDAKTLLVTAREAGGAQIWEVAYPSGAARPVVTDLVDYRGISLTRDRRALTTIQYDRRSSIQFVPAKAPPGPRKRSTEGLDEGFYGMSFTPTGELVYASDASGNHDLWLVAVDGVSTRQLTNHPAHDSTPSVSPDGRSVVFISHRGDGKPHVWRMEIDGRNPKQLTNQTSEGTPSFTPDGKWVVYAAASSGVWKIPAGGGTPVPIASGYFHTPSVSPDGTRVVCIYRAPGPQSVDQLAVVSLVAGQPMQVLDFPDTIFGSVIRWTADGRSLIHVGVRDGVANLWTLPLDGSAPQQLTTFPADLIFNFAYTRDYRELAVARGTVVEHVVVIRDFR